ncbi:MAG TPA: hypothetical protein VJM11_03220 [Nevskiaceae bacterium]|nr:hypothetical protein [Nevskiaceae bacterium]
MSLPNTTLQIRSLIRSNGDYELALVEAPVPAPKAHEVVVRVEAAPINPSDLGLMLGAADLRTAAQGGTAERPVITAKVPPAALKGMAQRLDLSMPVGNEGAGVVVAAGSSSSAQALLGRTVAMFAGGETYSQYRCISLAQCVELPTGVTPREGASAFVNPLTALGMVETMRREGHRALVHTAAASNLGHMLNRICLQDGVPLVNVVRKPAQAEALRAEGARFVCDSSQPTFMEDLTAALATTGATIAFDAVGGGKLAGQLLSAMEAAINRSITGYNRYGSSTHKQVYIYGALDRAPTEFKRDFGMAWSIGGWLLFPFLSKAGAETTDRMKARVVSEIRTTFASHYTKEISLAQAVRLEEIAIYGAQATGTKVLINPTR